jgi:hypothetical protein
MQDLTQTLITNREKAIINLRQAFRSPDKAVFSEGIEKLISEGGEVFYKYVEEIGLAKDYNLMVLSSKHNYYYDYEELNNVKTVINLKELNHIKQLKSHLQSYLRILPEKGNFVGCFVDNMKIDRYVLRYSLSSRGNNKRIDDIENSIVSSNPLINMFYSIMDFKTNIFLSEKSVTCLLKDYGFNIINMTYLNGLTYFHSQKVGKNYN